MLRKLAPLLLVGVAVIVGIFGYMAMRTPAAPSGQLQAVPLQIQNGAASAPAAATAPQVAGVAVTSATDPASSSATNLTLFQIQPGQSKATFTLTELLNGSPNTVVGTTDQVAGQLAFDPTAPITAQVGTITVDARGLTTDDRQRNRMIQNVILSTGQFEYVTFQPTSVSGLPPSGTPGQSYNAEIAGQLTIRDVTKPVTFTATVTPASTTQLSGSAKTLINRSDWNLQIPSIPFVASVSDQVQLQLDFVATAA
ncbi:MAG: hypothetical protein QOF51_2840 [Chloroflexota bacterium]|nr:hypothetical protein [Chloroflexota bacterium]